MIQLTAPHPAPAVAAKSAGGSVQAPTTAAFALSLADFLDTGDDGATPIGQRQQPAGRGSELPADVTADEDSDTDPSADVLAWLMPPVQPVAPTPSPLALTLRPPVQPRQPGEPGEPGEPEVVAAGVAAAAIVDPALAGATGGPDAKAAAALAAPTVLPQQPTARGEDAPAATLRPPLVQPTRGTGEHRAIAAGPAPPVTPAPVQPLQPAQAGEVFAAALHAATGDPREPAARITDDPTAATTPLTAVDTAAPRAIAATADAQQAPLDMNQPRWPHAMIDRIEALRDQADAADTRIRLHPDALGAIDVAVRRDGDAVRVHFTADQADTRALLADARPQLTDLAERRGIRLAETSVDLGNGGADASPGRDPAANYRPALAARPASPASPTTDDAATDTRLA